MGNVMRAVIRTIALTIALTATQTYSDGRPSHCGYEAYTLVRTPQGWKVINFADTDTPLRGRSIWVACPR
jgi:hypothetical protein